MSPRPFEVIYQVGMSRRQDKLMLYAGTESEAKEKLRKSGGVPANEKIIIFISTYFCLFIFMCRSFS